MEAGFLVSVIIVLTAFVLIAGTIFRFMSSAEDKQAETLCKDSIALRAATSLNVKETEFRVSPVLCKTLDKKISGSKEEVESQIAQKMARCWEIFGEGSYKTGAFDNTNLFAGGNKCFMCYTIAIDESSDFKRDSQGISGQEFQQYLRETTYDKKKQTYLDYFQFGGGPGYVVGLLSEEGIKPGRGYGIAFKAKAQDSEGGGDLLLGGGLSAGIGAIGFYTIGIGGSLLGGGAALAGIGAYSLISDLITDTKSNVDAIMLVDLSNEEISRAMNEKCEFVSDIGGK
ncbi:hypothetical protein COV20_04840 [Candidatus Woesearchaeota archaeon CG10_big_fil_rev_8_21_14_0_10_45_16]|nr:MAG: hypothetical protein COV20_04840 [Candidatus Woesearchaeota archaeon CG10_big_fil_rev_8_21_14_0_10_45_16]